MMRTRRNSRAAWPLAVAWAFAGALALSLAKPSVAAAQSECSEYISGGPSNPASGTLLGSRLIKQNLGGSVSVSGGGVSGGISGGGTATFYVGVYLMEGEGRQAFRCDSYEPWGLL